MRRHRPLGGGFSRDHVAVEGGWTPHRLAGVVDDEVEPLPTVGEVSTERIDTRGVAQVEAEHLEVVAPVGEVRFARVPARAVAGKPSGDDQLRPGAQQLDPRLITDLDATAGEERYAAAKVSDFASLGEVEVAASVAELVVERVHLNEVLFADVTVLRLDDLARLARRLTVLLNEPARRLEVRRREDGPVAQQPQTGIGKDLLVVGSPLRLLAAPHGLSPPPPSLEVGLVQLPGGGEKPSPLLNRQPSQESAVADDSLERLDRRTESGRALIGGALPVSDSFGIPVVHLAVDRTHASRPGCALRETPYDSPWATLA